MKFKVKSAYFDKGFDNWVKVMKSVCSEEEGDFYLEVSTLTELEDKLEKLSAKYTKWLHTTDCFNPDAQAVIRFRDRTIMLYDYYLD